MFEINVRNSYVTPSLYTIRVENIYKNTNIIFKSNYDIPINIIQAPKFKIEFFADL